MHKILFLAGAIACLAGCTPIAKKDQHQAAATNAMPSPLTQAVDLIDKNNSADAKKILDDYVNARPADWTAKIQKGKQLNVFFWDKEQLAECAVFEIVAAGDLQMEPVLDASYSKAYYLLAYLALESRNNPYNTALAYLDQGLALEPQQPTLLYEKAHLFYVLKQHDKAIAAYNKLLNTTACFTDPQRSRAYRGLGETLVAQAKYDDAEIALYASLKFDSTNKQALNELEYIDQLRNLKLTSKN